MATKAEHIPDDLSELDDFLAERESFYDLKEGTGAKVVWNGESVARKTDYSIVYLHGFRASHPEGYPVHCKVAEELGCNLYLSRLEEHGVRSDYPLLHLTEQKLLRSARFAFEIGRRIGHNVILMGTSTGGSLALWLAAQPELKDQISSLVLYSPLIRFYGLKEKLLMHPAGRRIISIIPGRKYLVKTRGTTYAEDRIWNKEYAMQGALSLGSFIEHYMQKKMFSEVQCPTFIGYYYKNKKEQDKVVSVPAIKQMGQELSARTKFVNFPEAKSHVICSSLLSNTVQDVIKSSVFFLKDVASHITSENR